jgi:uncharacterized protein
VFYGVVTGVPRPFRETGVHVDDALLPCALVSPCDIPRFDGNPERIRVSSFGAGGTGINVTAGTTVTGIVGPLDYGFRTYTVFPETTPAISALPTFTPVPAPLADELTVASLNLQRFFDDQNDPDFPIPGTGGTEPILTPAAWARRLNKASLTIREVLRTPDILGLVEVENQAAVDALAARLNADAVAAGAPNPQYVGVVIEGSDIGGIDVGFLWKQGRLISAHVEQVGKDTTYTNPNTGGQELLNDRPPLVLRATALRPVINEPFDLIVVVNHLRSLNSLTSMEPNPTNPALCVPGALCTAGARVRAKRQAQAEYLATMIQDLQASNPAARVLAIGDFNAFDQSDGYVDVMGTIKGTPTPPDQVVVASPDLVNPDLTNLQMLLPASQRYSYVFDGNAQTLDHAVANARLLPWVTRFAYGRSNADFAEILFNDGTRPERLTDHDGSVAYIGLGVPRLTGRVVSSAAGASTLTIEVTNIGGGHAYNVAITQLLLRTLAGTGTVTHSTPLPILIPALAPGQSHEFTVQLTVPPTVTRFSITEHGAHFDAGGARRAFSLSQLVIP